MISSDGRIWRAEFDFFKLRNARTVLDDLRERVVNPRELPRDIEKIYERTKELFEDPNPKLDGLTNLMEKTQQAWRGTPWMMKKTMRPTGTTERKMKAKTTGKRSDGARP